MIFRKLAMGLAALGLGAAMVITPASAAAQVKDARQNMASGPGVWRIELRNFNEFKGTTRLADRDLKEEIHQMEVKLENEFSPFGVSVDHQFHSVREHSRNMSSPLGVGNRAYVQRKAWHNITWMQQPRKTYNLWIHTRQYVEEPGGDPLVFFAVTVATRELDCVRKRICDRGSKGQRTHLFKLPIPKVKSGRCIAGNTYRFSHERKMVDERRVWDLVLASLADPQEKHVIPASQKRSSPDLFVNQAEICIASTSK